MSRTFALVKPKIVVNGLRKCPIPGGAAPSSPSRLGSTRSTFTRHTSFPDASGPADYTVAVQPNQWVELEYKTPVWTFSPGALGPPPQKYNGMILAAVVAVLVVSVTAIVVFGVLPSL